MKKKIFELTFQSTETMEKRLPEELRDCSGKCYLQAESMAAAAYGFSGRYPDIEILKITIFPFPFFDV